MTKRFVVQTAAFSTWVQDTLKGRKVQGTGSNPEEHAQAADRLNKEYAARILTAEEIRVLRKEVRGLGHLVKAGLIVVTDAGRQFIAHDDTRILESKASAGSKGGDARADTLSRKERVRIATKGSRAARKAKQ